MDGVICEYDSCRSHFFQDCCVGRQGVLDSRATRPHDQQVSRCRGQVVVDTVAETGVVLDVCCCPQVLQTLMCISCCDDDSPTPYECSSVLLDLRLLLCSQPVYIGTGTGIRPANDLEMQFFLVELARGRKSKKRQPKNGIVRFFPNSKTTLQGIFYSSQHNRLQNQL